MWYPPAWASMSRVAVPEHEISTPMATIYSDGGVNSQVLAALVTAVLPGRRCDVLHGPSVAIDDGTTSLDMIVDCQPLTVTLKDVST